MLNKWTKLDITEITAVRRRLFFLFLPFVIAAIVFSTFSVIPYVQIIALVFLFLFGIVEYVNGYKGAALSDGLLGLLFIYLFYLM
jgi:hypothetical protein